MVTKIKSNFKDYAKTFLDSFRLHDKEPHQMLTQSDMENLYRGSNSFTDYLPWKEYTDDGYFLLADERSVAACYDIFPANAEGVMLSELSRIRDNFQNLICEVFPQEDCCPWVIEMYQNDTLSLSTYAHTVRKYIDGIGKSNSITKAYLPIFEQHLKDVCKEGGLFNDQTVTGCDWRGSIRSYRLVFYRKFTAKEAKKVDPVENLDSVSLKVESALKSAGVRFSKVDGKGFYEWMIRWFNPRPKITDGDVDLLLKNLPYETDEDLPYGSDFSEALLYRPPVSDDKTGCWYFDDLPHKIVTVQNLRRRPSIGSTSAPKQMGDHIASMFDRMPEGTVLSMKIVITPIDDIESKTEMLEDRAVGTSAKVERIRQEIATAKTLLADNKTIYPVEICCFIRGENETDIRRKQSKVVSLLQQEGLNCIDDENDPLILDSYVRNLPMNFEPSLMDSRRRSRLVYSQHIANLMPVMGRGKGTGNPGMSFFNRGGEPMCFDPLNPDDRAKNAHLVLFGPTGSGKSATITSLLLFYFAVYNPRVFLVEAGDSFSMLREFIEAHNCTTNYVKMSGSGSKGSTVIPPFANAYKALEQQEKEQKALEEDVVQKVIDDFNSGKLNEEDESESKDYLGEMEIVARIMVSGGKKEEAKRIKLGDQQLIREAIINAAKRCLGEGKPQVRTSDVATELELISSRNDVPEAVKERFFDYAAAMRMFTQGLAGKIFNQYGELWPEVDFTHIDLAEFTKDSKEAELAVSYMSILNSVNDIAERDQNNDRPIIFLTDEAHLITKNPLLAPGIVKIVKMWRKLGAWLWLATQNMEDFPDEAEVMLSLFEWWVCLAVEPDEVDKISRFKKLTKQQEHLLLSTRKQEKAYTEGVVFSSNLAELFRNVPPSIALSMAGTEKHQKRERQQIIDETGCTKLEAAKVVAARIDKDRGIVRA